MLNYICAMLNYICAIHNPFGLFAIPPICEPGRSGAICRRMVVGGKNPPDRILNRYSESQLDLARNARASHLGLCNS